MAPICRTNSRCIRTVASVGCELWGWQLPGNSPQCPTMHIRSRQLQSVYSRYYFGTCLRTYGTVWRKMVLSSNFERVVSFVDLGMNARSKDTVDGSW
jgi:hypothetical protein